ncbi:unnamed protein product [Lymnaea stagnalis]|uniref:Uncharacterized protein n=1 Tax=Lymnaea stagnalis TaxID=6523 RepID=A0AAV2H8U9_LYMST
MNSDSGQLTSQTQEEGSNHTENKHLIKLANSKQTSAQINQAKAAKNKSQQQTVITSTAVRQASEGGQGGGHLQASEGDQSHLLVAKEKTKDKTALISTSGFAKLNKSDKKENIEAEEYNIDSNGGKKGSVSELFLPASHFTLNAEENNDLSSFSESDRETLGSSSSELAILRSPSRDSLNVGFDAGPVATSPVQINDKTPTNILEEGRDTPTEAPPHRDIIKINHNLNPEVETPSDLDKHLHSSALPQSSTSPQPGQSRNPSHSEPRPIKSIVKQSPVPTKSLTPQLGRPIFSVNPELFQQRSSDLDTDHLNHAPYSSQRLKPKGDAAKRSSSSSKEFTNTLYSQEEDSIKEDLAPDSLDIEKDSLDLVSELDLPSKDNPDFREEDTENNSQDLDIDVSKGILVVEQTNDIRKVSSPRPDNTKSQRDFISFGRAVQKETGREDSYLSLKPGYWDIAPVNSQERDLPAPFVETDNSKLILKSPHTPPPSHLPSRTPSAQTAQGEYFHSTSHDGDTNNSSELTPIINTNKEKPKIFTFGNSQSSNTTGAGKEKAVFILKSDPNKSRQSRQSSAKTSGRLSQNSQAQFRPDTNVMTATSATRNPGRVTSSANKVYVTSPTFSDDEEGMYRLVNSRLDGADDDRLDTYRELDLAAIQSQENYGGGAKIPSEKRVSYNDGGRYEDRDKGVNGVGSNGKSDNADMFNPYGMQMSGPNRSDLHLNTYPKDGTTWSGQQQDSSNITAHRPQDFGTGSDVESRNPQQGRIISHNPQFLQQPGSTSQPPQPNQLPHRQTRARGISLPTGPSYDPRDEEDLQRETSYQQGLRMRVEDGLKKVQEVEIPKVPLNHGQDGSQDFARDSLDYYNDDATARAFVEAFRPDPSDSFDLQKNQFRNPPPLPQAFSGNPQQPVNARLNNVNFDSEDYVDYEDIRHQRVNPQVQQRFYKPQLDANQRNDVMDSDRYVDVNTTARSEYNNRQENTPRYPQQSLAGRNDHNSTQPGSQRLTKPVEEEPMEAVQPKPPKYDYVNNNKEDYGKPQPKSYTHIHEVTKEEKEKLNEIFIHPKPKPKAGILKKKGEGQGSHRGTENIDPNQRDDEYREMSPAEQVWAQRSASLAKRFDHKNGRGKQRGGPGGLQKYNSDSSLNQIRPQQLPPDRRAFMTEMPTPPSQESSLHNQVSLPMSPRHSDIQVLPVSSQIILDDGQRISVDVNLKLISPSHQYQPYQDPPPHHPPAYYGGAGRGRQYPAVTQFDNENYNNGLQALEYSSADYGKEDYSYVSPRERYSADEALRALSESRTEMNPYGKIPPIPPRSSDPGHPSSAPLPDQGGSYIDMYRKQKGKDNEKPWYRVYGLKDYRKMQKEVRLGTLGPDLDSDAIKERREKFQRQSEYAKVVMERNKNDLAHRKPPAFPRPKEENDILNRRKVAVEYAKSVPKPVAKPQPNEYNNYELASEKSPIAKHHRKPGDMLGPGTQKYTTPSPRQVTKQKEMDVLDLDKLRQRYEEDKQNEALIRRNTSSSLPKGEKYY